MPSFEAEADAERPDELSHACGGKTSSEACCRVVMTEAGKYFLFDLSSHRAPFSPVTNLHTHTRTHPALRYADYCAHVSDPYSLPRPLGSQTPADVLSLPSLCVLAHVFIW